MKNFNKQRPQIKRKHKINSEINSFEVRLVGRGEPQVISLKQALSIALDEEKDVILINESQNPPIVKIEDYNRFLYEQEKIEEKN